MNFPQLTFFKESEFDRPEMLNRDLLWFIDQVRALSGVAIRITSDYRSFFKHNKIYPVGTHRPDSPHLRGTALDFAPVVFNQTNRMLVLWAILDLWRQDQDSPVPIYSRLGLEIADRHFHIDFDTVLTRPHLWTGRSK